MPSDVPAALPLIAYVLGLVCGFSVRDAIGLIVVAILLAVLRRAREALLIGLIAAGIMNGRPSPPIGVSEERFVRVDAPIDRDWSARGEVSLLRVPWRDGTLTIYARFAPKGSSGGTIGES